MPRLSSPGLASIYGVHVEAPRLNSCQKTGKMGWGDACHGVARSVEVKSVDHHVFPPENIDRCEDIQLGSSARMIVMDVEPANGELGSKPGVMAA